MLRIDRPPPPSERLNGPPASDLLTRHKSSLVLDLKSASGIDLLRLLLRKVDVLIDPYRPGILEGLGLNPTLLLQENPRLIVARLTGFRRSGKYAQMAGHDINYLAVSGILSQLGRAGQPPYPPANILADFAGGGLMCAMGILLALINRQQTGKGQVVEANMVDGSGYLGTFMRLARRTPIWDQPRGENLLDGGCPWYAVYQCRDGGYMAVGALESKFFQILLRIMGLGIEWIENRYDRSTWPQLKQLMQEQFLEKTRKEWEAIFEGKDACCTPVLDQEELEEDAYEQRLAVEMTDSAGLNIPAGDSRACNGLSPGDGGEYILQDWMGWRLGRDYVISNEGLVMKEIPKL